MELDYLSLATTPIYLLKGECIVSQGTGFYYARETDKVLFLVTNYHVLTGSSPVENKPPIGDSIEFEVHKSQGSPAAVRRVRLHLFTQKGHARWISSTVVPDADLAVIPLWTSVYDDCHVNCLSESWACGDSLRVRPTSSVTLVGYPCGLYDKVNHLPIWKTGTVASEPEIDFDGRPLFLVDVSAFPGMSGSPVIAFSYGLHEKGDGGIAIGGAARRFLGIFASIQMRVQHKFLEELARTTRLGVRSEESLELGHVWKAKLIVEIIRSLDLEAYRRTLESAS